MKKDKMGKKRSTQRNMKNAYAVLVGKHQRKRAVERPRDRLNDDI
jgi:hypothetical protein